MTTPNLTTLTELRRALEELGGGPDAVEVVVEWFGSFTLICVVIDGDDHCRINIEQWGFVGKPQPRTLRAAYDAMARMMGDA